MSNIEYLYDIYFWNFRKNIVNILKVIRLGWMTILQFRKVKYIFVHARYTCNMYYQSSWSGQCFLFFLHCIICYHCSFIIEMELSKVKFSFTFVWFLNNTINDVYCKDKHLLINPHNKQCVTFSISLNKCWISYKNTVFNKKHDRQLYVV